MSRIVLRPAYRYQAELSRMIDGDTMVFDVDCGFHVHVHATVRLNGWNCPERSTEHGPRATAASEALLRAATVIILETERDVQSFARWVARIWVDGQELGALLEAAGWAKKL